MRPTIVQDSPPHSYGSVTIEGLDGLSCMRDDGFHQILDYSYRVQGIESSPGEWQPANSRMTEMKSSFTPGVKPRICAAELVAKVQAQT